MWLKRYRRTGIYTPETKKTYAFAGTHHGAGTTMISLNYAYYLSHILNKRTAFIETVFNHDMEKFQYEWMKQKECVETQKIFNINKLAIYKSVPLYDIPQILNENYIYLIFDFGVIQQETLNEYIRCCKKIIVCNFAPWKRNDTENFLAEVRAVKGYRDWEYILNFSTQEICRNYILDNIIRFKWMPVIGNCFCLNNDVLKLYKSIL